MNWISSDYSEGEKLLNMMKIHKIPNLPITDEPITIDPMLQQAGLQAEKYNYQELIGGVEKRQIFVYNHDQCISYKDGSKSSSHIIYSEPDCIEIHFSRFLRNLSGPRQLHLTFYHSSELNLNKARLLIRGSDARRMSTQMFIPEK